MCVRLLDVLFKFVVFFFDFLLDCFCCSVLKLSNLSLILPSIFFTSLVILTSRSLICFFIHILMFLLKLLSLWNIAKIAVLCSCILILILYQFLVSFRWLIFSFYYGHIFLFLCVICSFGFQILETLPLLVLDMFFLLVNFLSCIVGCSYLATVWTFWS